MKYYFDSQNDKILKKSNVYDFSIENNEAEIKNIEFNNRLFSTGTPQLCTGKYQWGALYNPKNSKVKLFLDNICVVNFSSTPIIQNHYLNPKINYEGYKYMYGDSNSLNNQNNSNGVVIFNQGEDNQLFLNEANTLRVCQAFYTDNIKKSGSIIIPPGKSILILINSMDNSTPSSSISYTWWEE